MELLNGHIYVHIDLGSGSTKIRASKRRVDDGVWHDFSVRRNQRDVRAAVDGSNVDFKTTGMCTLKFYFVFHSYKYCDFV